MELYPVGYVRVLLCVLIVNIGSLCWILNNIYPFAQEPANKCIVERLELSETHLVGWGNELIVHTIATCSAGSPKLTLIVANEIVIEQYIPELWYTIQTAHYPFGRLDICILATQQNASPEEIPARMCHTVFLVESNTLRKAPALSENVIETTTCNLRSADAAS